MLLARLLFSATLLVVASVPAARAEDRPMLLLVSLDGFRWDYLDRPGAVRLRELAARGVRAERLIPVFPAKTFPAHYSIVTGLYPEQHGIIANSMWDDRIGRRFALSEREAIADPRWWGGEPIWVTAEKQGRRAAAFFWPGSDVEIQGTRPTWYRDYDSRTPNARRVNTVLDWLARPPEVAPQVVTLYFSDVDDAGHARGPDAPETDAAIARVDSLVGALMDGLAERNLADRVNLMVVSDHGMAATSRDRQILLDQFLDMRRVRVVDWSPVLALIPDPDYLEDVYACLRDAHPHLRVYRKAELPERLRYQTHLRITPIVAIADEGWRITTRGRLRERRPEELDGGDHGYDPELLSMGALFIAAGPAFKQGEVVPPIQAIHLYELMAEILGVRPAPNNGNLDAVRGVLRRP